MGGKNAHGIAIHEEGSGDGGTIVLMHGVFMDHTMWDDVVPHLRGRILRIDMPGHGSSPEPADGATLDDHIEAVVDALDGLGVRNAVVVGHSWGGMVGLRIARTRPDIVTGLVLSNTPMTRTRGMSRVGFRFQRLLLAMRFPLRTYGRMASRALIGAEHLESHPEAADRLSDRLARIGHHGVREALRSVLLEPSDSLGLLDGLMVPWTFVAGRDDYVLSNGVDGAIRTHGELRVVGGAHSSPMESPEAVAAAIAAVSSISAPTA